MLPSHAVVHELVLLRWHDASPLLSAVPAVHRLSKQLWKEKREDSDVENDDAPLTDVEDEQVGAHNPDLLVCHCAPTAVCCSMPALTVCHSAPTAVSQRAPSSVSQRAPRSVLQRASSHRAPTAVCVTVRPKQCCRLCSCPAFCRRRARVDPAKSHSQLPKTPQQQRSASTTSRRRKRRCVGVLVQNLCFVCFVHSSAQFSAAVCSGVSAAVCFQQL